MDPQPCFAVGDGALGFWSALREVFPETREQRCWFHKAANSLVVLTTLVLGNMGVSIRAYPIRAILGQLWCSVRTAARSCGRTRPAAYASRISRSSTACAAS
jgi:hypothetical protein